MYKVQYSVQFISTHSEHTYIYIHTQKRQDIEELCCSRGNLVSKCFSHPCSDLHNVSYLRRDISAKLRTSFYAYKHLRDFFVISFPFISIPFISMNNYLYIECKRYIHPYIHTYIFPHTYYFVNS